MLHAKLEPLENSGFFPGVGPPRRVNQGHHSRSGTRMGGYAGGVSVPAREQSRRKRVKLRRRDGRVVMQNARERAEILVRFVPRQV